jgi:3-dehydroquinate dehydratase/shikimate dehydrogenase
MFPRMSVSPLRAGELRCEMVFDAVYRPMQTRLLELAAERGIKCVPGVEMFLAQGVAQFEIWTGKQAPEAAMRKAVLAALR